MIYNMRGDTYHAGPVMLSDVYTSVVGSAKDGVAASQRALYEAYNSLNSSKASGSRVYTLESKLYGNIVCGGFANKYYLTVGGCADNQYWGLIFLCVSQGESKLYPIIGYNGTVVSTTGTIKTYKH